MTEDGETRQIKTSVRSNHSVMCEHEHMCSSKWKTMCVHVNGRPGLGIYYNKSNAIANQLSGHLVAPNVNSIRFGPFRTHFLYFLVIFLVISWSEHGKTILKLTCLIDTFAPAWCWVTFKASTIPRNENEKTK